MVGVEVVRGIYSPQPSNNRWGWAAVDGRTGQSGAPSNTVRCASHVPTVRVRELLTVGGFVL
jgi:hypothetical protein